MLAFSDGIGRKVLQRPPMNLLESEVEWLHTFNGLLDSDFFSNSVWILCSNVCTIRVSNTGSAVVKRDPKNITMRLAFDGTDPSQDPRHQNNIHM